MTVDRGGGKLELRTRKRRLQTAQKDGDSCFKVEIKKNASETQPYFESPKAECY